MVASEKESILHMERTSNEVSTKPGKGRSDNWVQTMIVRSRVKSQQPTFTLVVDDQSGKSRPIFSATKKGKQYDIFSEAKGMSAQVGSLSKTSSDGSAIVYTLRDHLNAHAATIVYDVPPIRRAFVDSLACRSVEMSLSGASLKTKSPTVRADGTKTLHFGGRGRHPSRKNLQLQNPQTGETVMQMVKWDSNEFNLDFGYPLDAFHSFGLALAQFDL